MESQTALVSKFLWTVWTCISFDIVMHVHMTNIVLSPDKASSTLITFVEWNVEIFTAFLRVKV